MSKKAKIAFSKILGLITTSRKALDRMLKFKTKYSFDDSALVGSLTCGDWAVSKACFEEMEECQFEDREYMISSHYDEILRAIFGDYMQLPPEEERVSNHGYKVFWKDNQ